MMLYKFNGNLEQQGNPDYSGELDEETGLYYYGARILLSAATLIPYVGWAYGAIDIGVLMITRTSVTDRVGMFVDEHWGQNPIRH
jgi:hypothetical protein